MNAVSTRSSSIVNNLGALKALQEDLVVSTVPPAYQLNLSYDLFYKVIVSVMCTCQFYLLLNFFYNGHSL